MNLLPDVLLPVVSVPLGVGVFVAMRSAAASRGPSAPPVLPDLSRRIVGRHAGVRRGEVLTVDDRGQVRSGPAGAWWSELAPRIRDAAGMSLDELPAARARAWNVAALLVLACLLLWARYVNGWAWSSLLAGVLVALVLVVAGVIGAAHWWSGRLAARHTADLARWRAVDAARAARSALVELERRGAAVESSAHVPGLQCGCPECRPVPAGPPAPSSPAPALVPTVGRLSEAVTCESCLRRRAALLVILGPDAEAFAVCGLCAPAVAAAAAPTGGEAA